MPHPLEELCSTPQALNELNPYCHGRLRAGREEPDEGRALFGLKCCIPLQKMTAPNRELSVAKFYGENICYYGGALWQSGKSADMSMVWIAFAESEYGQLTVHAPTQCFALDPAFTWCHTVQDAGQLGSLPC